jgi:hypothetical protein
MAIANSSQILIDTNKRTVIKRVGILDSDETSTVWIDPRALAFALNANNQPYQAGNTTAPEFANSAFTISRVIAAVDAEVGHLQLVWQGTVSDKTAFALGVGSIDTNPQYQLPVITNNSTGPTGNLLIKTVGTTANAAYTIIIELHKDNRFYDAGWGRDPAAFNYGPYAVKP